MKNEVNKIAKDTNYFLKKFINNQNSSHLINAMKYGLFPGGKKIRSKILIDFGSLFSIRYKTLIQIGAAVECIHAYSLIHDDLPCMDLIKKLSECSGHLGIAGGQYLDLHYEKKKVSRNKIIDMEIKKTGMLFSFCCAAPAIIKNKKNLEIRFFENIGSDIGLLFQISDDLIDHKGNSKIAGKKTGKDQKKGKATLIGLLGYNNAVKYCNSLIININKKLQKYGSNSKKIKQTLEYILNRDR